MEFTTLTVYEGTMINHEGKTGTLRMGTGNFGNEKFVDEKGVEMRGATAGLWLAIRGKAESNAVRRVHGRQRIGFHQFRINILSIGSDPHGVFVRCDISEPDGAANTAEKGA